MDDGEEKNEPMVVEVVEIDQELSLRTYRAGDESDLVACADNPEVARALRDVFPHPYTMSDAVEWIRLTSQRRPARSLAVCKDDRVIGGIGLTPFHDVQRYSAEIGYFLGQPFWGRGIMTKAVRAFCDYAFDNFELNRLQAGVFAFNPASGRVLEKAGFTLEGTEAKSVYKQGRFVDRHIYALVRELTPRNA